MIVNKKEYGQSKGKRGEEWKSGIVSGEFSRPVAVAVDTHSTPRPLWAGSQ